MQEDLRLAFPTQLTRPFTETDGIEKCVVRKEIFMLKKGRIELERPGGSRSQSVCVLAAKFNRFPVRFFHFVFIFLLVKL